MASEEHSSFYGLVTSLNKTEVLGSTRAKHGFLELLEDIYVYILAQPEEQLDIYPRSYVKSNKEADA